MSEQSNTEEKEKQTERVRKGGRPAKPTDLPKTTEEEKSLVLKLEGELRGYQKAGLVDLCKLHKLPSSGNVASLKKVLLDHRKALIVKPGVLESLTKVNLQSLCTDVKLSFKTQDRNDVLITSLKEHFNHKTYDDLDEAKASPKQKKEKKEKSTQATPKGKKRALEDGKDTPEPKTKKAKKSKGENTTTSTSENDAEFPSAGWLEKRKAALDEAVASLASLQVEVESLTEKLADAQQKLDAAEKKKAEAEKTYEAAKELRAQANKL